MRITTWNINGLRSGVRSGFETWLAASKNDIVCLQEVKTEEDLLTRAWFRGYEAYFNAAIRPGYSGVATLVSPSLSAERVETGIGDALTDPEGRVISIEFSSFIVINAYAPHSHRLLTRLEHKRVFSKRLLDRIREMRRGDKPIILVGDLNVAHQEVDLANPKGNRKNAGFLPEEREWFSAVLAEGLIDAFRVFTQGAGYYTWWSMRSGVKERNVGWRLDYILVDTRLREKIRACFHSPDQLGSDHCPVTAEIEI